MYIIITIDIDNDAFVKGAHAGIETARILRGLAASYELTGVHGYLKLRDISGNEVGAAKICE